MTVGEARPSTLLLKPLAVGSPSDHPNSGLWQLAHDRLRSDERRGSKNSCLPSSMRAALGWLSAGEGGVFGSNHFMSSLVGVIATSAAVAGVPAQRAKARANRDATSLESGI